MGADDPEDGVCEPILCGCIADRPFDQRPEPFERTRRQGKRVGRLGPAVRAEQAAEVRGEVEGFGELVGFCFAAQADVELRGVACQDRELYAEGRLDGFEARVALL